MRIAFQRLTIISSLAVMFAGLAAPASGQVSGAIFTTDSACEGTDLNIYGNKRHVYLDGGPRRSGSAGLPTGFYHVKITSPAGQLLGISEGTPIEVDANGDFVDCYQLWRILVKASNGRTGYDDTPNNGGVYKVWVSQNGDFPNSESKTDNFKVRRGRPIEVTEIRATKFYDLDTDGVRGDPALEPPIANWHIELRRADTNELVGCQLTDGGGEVSFIVTMDGTEYVVSETLVDDYINTTPLTVNVVADQAAIAVEFGNVCIVAREGLGRTPGFWHACNNGEGRVGCDILADCEPTWRNLLNDLCIVEPDGSDVVIPTGGSFEEAFAVLAGWIVGNGAEGNMAYILSRQLAATSLNRSCGFLAGGPMYFECPTGERVDLDLLLAEADALICANPYTPDNDPEVAEARAAQEAIKNCLDALNNNTRPVFGVSPTPCPFEPLPCP